MNQQNKLHAYVNVLDSKAFSNLYVHNKPLFYNGHDMQVVSTWPYIQKWVNPNTTNNPRLFPEDLINKGELIVRDLWKKGTYSITNICAMNTDDVFQPKMYCLLSFSGI